MARIRKAIPLSDAQKRRLFNKFTRVVRATVKGNIVVAVTQGLWAESSSPYSAYPARCFGGIDGVSVVAPRGGGRTDLDARRHLLLMTGAIWQGVILTLYGVLVIGLVDNILRPILVGKDTKMPDYVVLISTLGGLALFGLNGFVIGPLVAALFISTWGLFTSPEEPPPGQ